MTQTQTTMSFEPAPVTAPIPERAAAFHRKNLHVYEALRVAAIAAKRRGGRCDSIKGLVEDLRREESVTTQGERFKFNNTYATWYSELLMEREPELQGYFKLRGKAT